jgi:hypothetical protein
MQTIDENTCDSSRNWTGEQGLAPSLDGEEVHCHRPEGHGGSHQSERGHFWWSSKSGSTPYPAEAAKEVASAYER